MLMKPTRILFICFANTCRSPMAEAIARRIGGAGVEVFSAGLHPMGRVAPGTLMALESLGYPAEGLSSKGFEAVDLDSMDLIVSLMGVEGLSMLPRRLCGEKISWRIRDPYGEDDESYLATARILEKKIDALMSAFMAGEPFSI